MSKPGLKLMADYHCWPLWHHGGREVGNIDPAEVGVSEALAAKLESWAATFDSHLNVSDPAAATWTQEEENQFEAEGRRLCRALGAEIGCRFTIVYSSRCIPVETLDANRPNKAPEPTAMAVTTRAPSSTARASHGRGSS